MIPEHIELKNLANVFSGAPLSTFIDSDEEVVAGLPLINIRDIDADQIDHKNLSIISLNNIRRPERFCVEPGDVIITCRGTQFKVAIVPDKISQAIITSNLIAIRPDPSKLSSIYLAAYLKTRAGERELWANRTSQTAQIVLTVSSVEELKIPLPPLAVQEKISQTIQALDDEYHLNQESAELNRKMRKQIVEDLLNQKI